MPAAWQRVEIGHRVTEIQYRVRHGESHGGVEGEIQTLIEPAIADDRADEEIWETIENNDDFDGMEASPTFIDCLCQLC